MRLIVGIFALTLAGCATLADGGGGDLDLPSAAAGPFRALRTDELIDRVGPYVARDASWLPRDVSVLDDDGDLETPSITGYFAANIEANPEAMAPPSAIVTLTAIDGRSFGFQRTTALEPELAWEGGWVGAPSALRVGDEVWLYYASEAGIGLAKSVGGGAFTRLPGPVLTRGGEAWEAGSAPTSPSVIRMPDGTYALFYEVRTSDGGAKIGEATSSDGEVFTRVGGGPVLAPGDDYDAASVGSPSAVLARTREGREVTRLYYTAVDGEGQQTIALAARFGAGAPFVRAATPVFGQGSGLSPREPAVIAEHDGTLLFATEASKANNDSPAVAAAISR